MQVSVSLRPLFSYSIIYLILVIFIIIALSIFIILKRKKKVVVPENIEIEDTGKKNIRTIKIKYLKKLNIIEKKLEKNEISIRKAYQNLSAVIRYFVHAVTGIKVQNCTLEDIKKMNMPLLYELIKEYYTPEFAEKSVGDVKSSIEKTRKVIKKWN